MTPPLRLIASRTPSLLSRRLTTNPSHHYLPVPRPLHTSSAHPRSRARDDNGPVPDQPPPTDFARMDVLSQTPPPATSIDACLPDGFVLGDGNVTISDGSGALLVAGEAFRWRPWADGGRRPKTLVDEKGRWEPDGLDNAFGLLSLVWPRPDLLILGLGPEMRPISPAVRKHIAGLGIRVEVADTRNAASQFNLLATERGVDQVAAALIPIGWKEGVGAG